MSRRRQEKVKAKQKRHQNLNQNRKIEVLNADGSKRKQPNGEQPAARKKDEGKQAGRKTGNSVGMGNEPLDPSANPHWQGMSPAWQQLYGAIRHAVEH